MTLQLKPTQHKGKLAKQIVRQEIDESLGEFSQPHETDVEIDEIIHEVRKHCKKIRAVLRLLRTTLGDKTYRRENIEFRETARPLRDVRDAQALIDSLDKLTRQAKEDLPLRACADLREILESRKHTACDQLLGPVPIYDQVTDKLRQADRRLRNWKLKRLDWSQLRGRVKHEFVTASQAFHVATAQQTPEHLHEWRKQVKYFSNQLQVLKPVWRKARKTLGKELDELADILGDDHDLARLSQTVEAESAERGEATEFEDLAIAIDDRRHELEQQAFALGKRVFGQPRKAILRQINRWWKAG